jgi:hypothetical protein
MNVYALGGLAIAGALWYYGSLSTRSEETTIQEPLVADHFEEPNGTDSKGSSEYLGARRTTEISAGEVERFRQFLSEHRIHQIVWNPNQNRYNFNDTYTVMESGPNRGIPIFPEAHLVSTLVFFRVTPLGELFDNVTGKQINIDTDYAERDRMNRLLMGE